MTGLSHQWVVALGVCAWLTASVAVESAAQQQRLQIALPEEQLRYNVIDRGTAGPLLVEVRDENDLPVSEALVLFFLRDTETATLNAGLQQVAVTTDAAGRASVSVNPIASGRVELQVTARFGGAVATRTIVQNNYQTIADAAAAGETVSAPTTTTTTAGGGGGLGTGAIVGLAAAGAAVGVGVAVAGGGSAPADSGPPVLPEPRASVPSAPSRPTVAAGDRQLVVSWTAPSNNGAAIVDYDVRYTSGSNWFWFEHPDSGSYTNTRVTIPDLTNGTTYEVQVRAANSEGESAWSPSGEGTPVSSASAPDAPTAPSVTSGDGQLTVSWTAPSDNGARIVDYDVRSRQAGSGDPWDEHLGTANSTATTYVIDDLQNGKTYEVQVRAANSEGESGWSPSGRGTPRATATAPDAPSAPSVEAGDGLLLVSWSAPADNGAAIVDYDVQYRAAGGSWQEHPDDGSYTDTLMTIPGLTNGTTYEVQVRAANSEGESGWSPSGRGTPRASATAPDAPSAPSVEAGDGLVLVSWSAPADNGAAIVDYDVQYRAAGGSWQEHPDDGSYTDTLMTIPGLTNGTAYEVQVRAANSEGESGWSPSGRGTPRASATAPDAPSAPSVEAGDGLLLVSWSAPADNGAAIVDYDVQYRAAGGSWQEHPDDGSYTDTLMTIPGLTNGTTYEVQVRAANSEGESGWSPSGRGTPRASATAPDAPSAPSVEAGDGLLLVSWSAPADNGAAIVDYDVQYRAAGGSWQEHPDDGSYTDTLMTIPGLTNGTAYEVQVRAANSEGESGWSPSGRGTPRASATAPDAPSAPSVEAGDGLLLVSWSAPADNGAAIVDYDVQYRAAGGSWQEHPDDGSYTDTLMTIPGLTNGTAYEVQVRAANSEGESGWSPSGRGTPRASATAPDAPSAPSVEAGDGLLLVSWSAPADNGAAIVDYDVQYRAAGGSWQEHPDDGSYTDTLMTIPGLTNGTAYEVQVRAANSEGESGWSPSGRGTPEAPASPDRAVLVELYTATGGGTWSAQCIEGWNSDMPIGSWYGVETDETARVVALNLWECRLTGSIPPSLGSLANLRDLTLGANPLLSGSIPSSLGSLAKLEILNLESTALNGSIPPSLGNLTNLTYLSLGNELTGSIPPSLGNFTELRYLSLRSNHLSGPIPPSFGNLAKLETLDLAYNDLSGAIPSSLGNLANLDHLRLFENQLTGSIPSGLCEFDINPQQGGVILPGCDGLTANFTGLAHLSVADADAEENVDDTIDFIVTLDRVAGTPVRVDYATIDASAQAGADYIATSGTLTFSLGERSKTVQVAILDDAYDEGEETFTFALSNAFGAVVVDGQATGRIENHDPLPRALLARFGRTAAVHVVEQVEERLQAPRVPGVEGRFAGGELRSGMKLDSAVNVLSRTVGQVGPGSNGPMGGGGLLDTGRIGGQPVSGVGLMGGGGLGSAPLGGLLDMGGGDWLNGSAFALNRETRQGGVLSFWSRGAQSSFMGREGALALNGDVRTTMFGADYAKGPVVVGLSLANSRGLGSYAGVDAGRVATSVTGLYPWLGYQVTDRVTVWGVTGYGAGGMMLTPGVGPALESGLSMAMAAGGTRGELIGGGPGGFGLAFKADALWVGTSVDGVDGPSGRLVATETAVTRFRTGLEGSREFLLAGRISLRPSAEVGLRHDGGDAETGAGVDVGGGLVVADSSTGLALDLRMRMLVLHQADGFRERGMALSLSYDPTPSTPLGFMARVAPSWGGEATGGAEALWGRETMAGLADGGFTSGNRLDTEIGYGLPVGSRFVGTPRVGVAATAYGRDYRMGYGLTLLERQTLNLELGVDARRRESPMQDGADHGVLGRVALGW